MMQHPQQGFYNQSVFTSSSIIYHGGEISLRLELLEEGGEEEGGEEEDDGPEEHVGDVGSVVAAGLARELPVEQVTHLG